MGLRLYPNGGGPSLQFESKEVWRDTAFYSPEVGMAPTRVSGTPRGDAVEFGFDRFLYFNVHGYWRPYLAAGVVQRRLVTGELILEASRGVMLRACWDVIDRRSGAAFEETATGVVTAAAELSPYAEQWTRTLHRGDFLLRNGVLEPAESGCGGS
jgi:hypothetical protein